MAASQALVSLEKKDIPASSLRYELTCNAKTVKVYKTYLESGVIIKADNCIFLFNWVNKTWVDLLVSTASFSVADIKDIFCLRNNKIILIYQKPDMEKVQLVPVAIMQKTEGVTCEVRFDHAVEIEQEGWYAEGRLSSDKQCLLIHIDNADDSFHFLFSVETLREISFGKGFFKELPFSSFVGVWSSYQQPCLDIYRFRKSVSEEKDAYPDEVGTIQLPADTSNVRHVAVSPSGRWVAWLSVKSEEAGTHMYLEVSPFVARMTTRRDVEDQVRVRIPFSTQGLTWLMDDSLVFLGTDKTNKLVQRFYPAQKKMEIICAEPAEGFTVVGSNILVFVENPARLFLYAGPTMIDQVLYHLIAAPAISAMPMSLLFLITAYVENKSPMEQAIERVCYLNGPSVKFIKNIAPSLLDRARAAARYLPLAGRLFSSPTSFEESEKKQVATTVIEAKLIEALERKEPSETYAACIDRVLLAHSMTKVECSYYIEDMINKLIAMDGEVVEVRFTF